MASPPEADGSFGSAAAFDDMTLDKLTDLVDDVEGIEVTLPLRPAPGKEAVAAENNAVAARVFSYGAAQHHAQFEPRTLPGKPGPGSVRTRG